MAQASESLAGEGRAAIYSVALELFEGPLDLLLHLVRRHELDILDIPIAFVAEKYLEYLDLMRSLDLEVAGDYLVMAATLAWLKSRELLPSAPSEEQATSEDEEGEDPREALIRRLVEYERFKSAASELDALPVAGRDVFARGADIDVPPMDPGLAPVTLFRLAEAYYRVLTRAKIAKSHDVTIEAVTVAQRMQQLTLMLDERQEFEFEALFLSRTWSSERELRGMLVVTLMSVLELVKLGVARVQQVPDSTAIRVYRLIASEEARRLVEGYDEEVSFGAPVELGPPAPSEAELDAIEEEKLLAEALAGLSGDEAEDAVSEIEALGDETLAAANEGAVEAELEEGAVEAGSEGAVEDEAVAAAVEDEVVEEAVLEDRPVEEAVLEERPVEEAVFEERPVEEAVFEDRPVEEAVLEDRPVEEAVLEDRPVEEAVFEDRPVEEAVLEDRPVEEAVLEDRPALGMSAEDEELAALAREIEALEAEERAAAMAAVREAPRGEDDEESP